MKIVGINNVAPPNPNIKFELTLSKLREPRNTTAVKAPPTILNGGSAYPVSTNDWTESMEWIKNNTPKDAVIASWWDYGYWISTLGQRASIAER